VKSISVKQHLLNLKKNKLKFSIKVTLKKDVLDPQGKVVEQTLQNMGMNTLKNLRQGKYFELEINENNEEKAKNKIEDMCKKLLVNLIIEDFEISKV
jgi:phosphoribosylformylglycinamidine synthase|tara:strand:- start:371 stop:661 length:291 start_codon:yes stop_codon:yes gene_type:complete